MTTPRKTYRWAGALSVTLAVLLVAPFFPLDRFPRWFEVLYFVALGFSVGHVGKAIARINEEQE